MSDNVTLYEDPLPIAADYPGSENRPWNKIPLGVSSEAEVSWDVNEDTNMFIAGNAGSGKSIVQTNVIAHCIQHSDMWDLIVIDPERHDFIKYEGRPGVKTVATSREQGFESLRFVEAEIEKRYKEMAEFNVNSFTELISTPKAIMVVIDDANIFMPERNGENLATEDSLLIERISQRGAAAGIHISVSTQMPRIKWDSFTARYATGSMKATPSTILMNSDIATEVKPEIRGRGVVMLTSGVQHLQAYFASRNWVDEWLVSKSK